jgi:hypothetical protein
VDGIAFGTRTRRVGVRQEPLCCGFATAGAEIGRPAYIVACRQKRLSLWRSALVLFPH